MRSEDNVGDFDFIAEAKELIAKGKQPSKAVCVLIRGGFRLPDDLEKRRWIADVLQGDFDRPRIKKELIVGD